MTETATPLHQDDRSFEGAVCARCGEMSRDLETCSRCGHAFPDDGDGLGIRMVFTNPLCECGGHVLGGSCETCGEAFGGEVPQDELTVARQKALAAPVQRVRDVVASLRDLPEPHLRVTGDQFVRAMVDSDIFGRAMLIPSFFGRAGQELRLTTSREVGGKGRLRVEEWASLCEVFRDRVAELAWCDPSEAAVPLRDAILDVAARVADIALEVAEMLVAGDAVEVGQRLQAVQDRLDTVGAGRLGALLEEIGHEALETESNQRVERAFGIEGDFVLPDGNVDGAAVFTALTGDDDEPMAHGSGLVLDTAKHLAVQGGGDRSTFVMLVEPLVLLSMRDNPVRAHRISSYLLDYLRKAWTADEAQTRTAVQRLASSTRRGMAAASRVDRRLDGLTEERATALDVETLAECYRASSEGSFRAFLRLVLDLGTIIAGKTLADDDGSTPTLGMLESRFADTDDELARLVLDAVDVDLRNAVAHENFEAGEDLLELLEHDRKYTSEELDDLLTLLQLVVQGMDIATSVFVLENDIAEDFDWGLEQVDDFRDIVLVRLFSMKGYRLQRVERGETVKYFIDDQPVEQRARLLTPVVACHVQFPDAQCYEVRRASSDELLLRLPAETITTFVQRDRDLSTFPLVKLNVEALLHTSGAVRIDDDLTRTVVAHAAILISDSAQAHVGPPGDLVAKLRREAALVLALVDERGSAKAIPRPVRGSLTALTISPTLAASGTHLDRLLAWRVGQPNTWPLF